MKFKKDFTREGYPILSLHGPDNRGEWCGTVDVHGNYYAVNWDANGKSKYASTNLVPDVPAVVFSQWYNVYRDYVGCLHESRQEADSGGKVRIGVIRVDWKSDGTFDVCKEE